MEDRHIVLRKERSGADVRYLGARLEEDGSLRIEGQDLGPAVESFWGPGQSEYEWDISGSAADVPAFVLALGGAEGDDVLDVLASRFAEDQMCATKVFLDEHGIPNDSWTRVGE